MLFHFLAGVSVGGKSGDDFHINIFVERLERLCNSRDGFCAKCVLSDFLADPNCSACSRLVE